VSVDVVASESGALSAIGFGMVKTSRWRVEAGYGSRVDDGCEHDWVLEEVVVSGRGADQVSTCARCEVVGYSVGRAAVKDTRPPLGDPQ